MAASPFTLEVVEEGVVPDGGRIGQFRAEVRDVVWTSDGSNETADATVQAVDLGMSRILGALWLGSSAPVTISDTHDRLTVDVNDDGSVDISALSGTSALDLDSTDTASARVLFLGY